MSRVDIVRAWKDPKYRRTLSDSQLTNLPENPAGLVELSDDELEGAAGGGKGKPITTAWFCTLPSFFGFCGCK